MKNNSKETFGKRLIELREGKNLSQKQCSSELGMEDASKYNKWENGKNAPDYDTVCELARFFGVTTDYLLGNSDAKKAENEDIAKRLGLSEKAIEFLERKYKVYKKNSITLTINTLLEDRSLLILIAEYLYYELSTDDEFTATCMFSRKYKYLMCEDSDFLEDDLHMGDCEPDAHVEMLGSKNLKALIMLHIQESLAELLKKENTINHF